MKKIAAIISSLVLLIAVMLPLNASAVSASGSFSGPSTIRSGDTIKLVYYLSGSGLSGLEGTLQYDTSKLTFKGVSQNIASPWIVEATGNKVIAYDNALSAPITSSKAIFTAIFVVKSLPVGTSVSVSYTNTVASDGTADTTANATYTKSVSAPVTTTKATTTKKVTTTKSNITTTKSLTEHDTTPAETTTQAQSKETKLASINVEGAQLSPAFSAEKTDYIVWLPYEAESLNVAGIPVDEKSTVEVLGNTNLVAGKANVVTITCTAEDGTKTVYTIKAMRAPLSGVYASDAQPAVSENTTSGTPIWLTIILCIALLVLGLIIGVLIGRRRNNDDDGPNGDDFDLGGNDSDSDDDDDFNTAKPLFRGIHIPSTPSTSAKYDDYEDVEEKVEENPQARVISSAPTKPQTPPTPNATTTEPPKVAQQVPVNPSEPPRAEPVKPNNTAQSGAVKFDLPYQPAGGSSQPQTQSQPQQPAQPKKSIPRNPFEMSADD